VSVIEIFTLQLFCSLRKHISCLLTMHRHDALQTESLVRLLVNYKISIHIHLAYVKHQRTHCDKVRQVCKTTDQRNAV